jgi:hypothetical protein
MTIYLMKRDQITMPCFTLFTHTHTQKTTKFVRVLDEYNANVCKVRNMHMPTTIRPLLFIQLDAISASASSIISSSLVTSHKPCMQ